MILVLLLATLTWPQIHCLFYQRSRLQWIRAQVWPRDLRESNLYSAPQPAHPCFLDPRSNTHQPVLFLTSILDQGSSFILLPHNQYKQPVALPTHHKKWTLYKLDIYYFYLLCLWVFYCYITSCTHIYFSFLFLSYIILQPLSSLLLVAWCL